MINDLPEAPERVKVFLKLKCWRFSGTGIFRPHAYQLLGIISIDIRNSLRKRTALFCECHNFYKANSPSLMCLGFFSFTVLIDLYPPKDSELCKYLRSSQAFPTQLSNGNVQQKSVHFRLGRALAVPWRDPELGGHVLGHLGWRSKLPNKLDPAWPIYASCFLPVPFFLFCWQEGPVLAGPHDFPFKLMRALSSLCLSLIDTQLPGCVCYWIEHLVLNIYCGLVVALEITFSKIALVFFLINF